MNRYVPKHLTEKSEDAISRFGEFDNENPDLPEAKSRPKELYLYVQTVLESVITAFLILTFVLSISLVIGSSMEPTLYENGITYKPDIAHQSGPLGYHLV